MTPRSFPVARFGPSSVSPARLGFRMPAEWEPHRATWLIWPHNRADWEIKTAAVEWCYADIVKHLVGGERVAILVQDAGAERRARRTLELAGVSLAQIDFHRIRTDRSWIRDSGPIFVLRSQRADRREVAITDWRFNGWARYRAWQRDDAIPARIAARLVLRRFRVHVRRSGRYQPFVLEGGSIDVNGRGLVLTTEECLLGPVQARNPGVSREAIEHVLSGALGVRRVLWLQGGIMGDDTHGHVDDVARFVASDTVVVAVESNRADPNYEPLRANRARLKQMSTLRGRPLRVIPVPMPQPLYFRGVRLPASYLNFYIGNRSVLVPTFNDPNDRVALGRLARIFPTRKVVGIHAADLVVGLGAVHCITQQEPA